MPEAAAACAHDAPIRRALARGLARVVELCRGFRALAGLGPSLLASPAAGQLWPEPHDRCFDFAGTAAEAAWIDELAAQARSRLVASAGEIVVAHSDWRAEHVRFEGERAFVGDYEAARGARFTRAERDTINAAWLYATAYGARCEHSDAELGLPWAEQQISDDSYRGLLARHGHEPLV